LIAANTLLPIQQHWRLLDLITSRQ